MYEKQESSQSEKAHPSFHKITKNNNTCLDTFQFIERIRNSFTNDIIISFLYKDLHFCIDLDSMDTYGVYHHRNIRTHRP